MLISLQINHFTVHFLTLASYLFINVIFFLVPCYIIFSLFLFGNDRIGVKN